MEQVLTLLYFVAELWLLSLITLVVIITNIAMDILSKYIAICRQEHCGLQEQMLVKY